MFKIIICFWPPRVNSALSHRLFLSCPQLKQLGILPRPTWNPVFLQSLPYLLQFVSAALCIPTVSVIHYPALAYWLTRFPSGFKCASQLDGNWRSFLHSASFISLTLLNVRACGRHLSSAYLLDLLTVVVVWSIANNFWLIVAIKNEEGH